MRLSLSPTQLPRRRFAATPTLRSSPAPALAQRLVVVSNRIAGGAGAAMSGGLAVAIQAALKANGGIWFGWSGEIAESPAPAPILSRQGNVTYAKLDLQRLDYDGYYNGFANRVLWPLFHYRPDLVDFRREDLAGYRRVNAQFAAQLAPLLQPGDLVWIHDYHLMTLGEELRALGVEHPIGFFLHTPFPPSELFRMLPNHAALMRALCACDLVGFQTDSDLDGFRSYIEREAGGRAVGGDRLVAFGRRLRAAAFPIGIDVDTVTDQASQSVGTRHMARLHESLRERKLMLGVDRLDYSKGLLARFIAFGRLFERFADTRGRLTFLQIAPPTRSEVPEYLNIRRSLEAEAGHINGRFAEFDWTPLRYLNRSFNRRTLFGLMRAAQIGLVTPLRDGVNLVAKE